MALTRHLVSLLRNCSSEILALHIGAVRPHQLLANRVAQSHLDPPEQAVERKDLPQHYSAILRLQGLNHCLRHAAAGLRILAGDQLPIALNVIGPVWQSDKASSQFPQTSLQ